MQIMQPPPVAQQAPSEPVVINNIVPQQKWNKRVGKIVTDADGNPSIEIFNVES
jgi:hypothetical protein